MEILSIVVIQINPVMQQSKNIFYFEYFFPYQFQVKFSQYSCRLKYLKAILYFPTIIQELIFHPVQPS